MATNVKIGAPVRILIDETIILEAIATYLNNWQALTHSHTHNGQLTFTSLREDIELWLLSSGIIRPSLTFIQARRSQACSVGSYWQNRSRGSRGACARDEAILFRVHQSR